MTGDTRAGMVGVMGWEGRSWEGGARGRTLDGREKVQQHRPLSHAHANAMCSERASVPHKRSKKFQFRVSRKRRGDGKEEGCCGCFPGKSCRANDARPRCYGYSLVCPAGSVSATTTTTSTMTTSISQGELRFPTTQKALQKPINPIKSLLTV